MKHSLETKAYVKMLLHACKYPHKAVNGILLGRTESSQVRIEDAIPLFHTCLGLSPMLEVALMQIDAYCQKVQLQICGYYHANENLNDNEPDLIAMKIADKICEQFDQAAIIMLDNRQVATETNTALKWYQCHDNRWSEKASSSWYLEDGNQATNFTSDMINHKAYQSLVDFDCHLDDVTQDWLNISLNKVSELIPG